MKTYDLDRLRGLTRPQLLNLLDPSVRAIYNGISNERLVLVLTTGHKLTPAEREYHPARARRQLSKTGKGGR